MHYTILLILYEYMNVQHEIRDVSFSSDVTIIFQLCFNIIYHCVYAHRKGKQNHLQIYITN